MDRRTIEVYDAKAGDYAARFDGSGPGGALRAFIAALPEGGRALDFGCGTGAAARHMADAGLEVFATDASAEMVRIASRDPRINVRQETFAELDGTAQYDGIWASFSLLHADRDALPGILGAIRRALRPGGVFYIALKSGTGSGRDSLGRLYTYLSADELDGLLGEAGFTITDRRTGTVTGLAGLPEAWISRTAHV